MERFCPFCGSPLDMGPQDSDSPTVACPTCGQEQDRPGPAPQPELPPNLETPPEPPLTPLPSPASGPLPQPADDWSQYQPQQAAAQPQPSGQDSPAWERDEGLATGLGRTIWQVLMHPMRTFAAPARPGITWPLGFALILGTLGGVVDVVWEAAGWGWSSGMVDNPLYSVLLAPLVVLFGLFLGAAILHFFLFVVGGAKAGYTATFRVLAYSHADQIFLLIPLVGPLVMAVWGLVISVAGLAAAHGVSRGRVIMAILLPLLVVLLLTALAVIVMGVAFFQEMLRSYPGLGI